MEVYGTARPGLENLLRLPRIDLLKTRQPDVDVRQVEHGSHGLVFHTNQGRIFSPPVTAPYRFQAARINHRHSELDRPGLDQLGPHLLSEGGGISRIGVNDHLLTGLCLEGFVNDQASDSAPIAIEFNRISGI